MIPPNIHELVRAVEAAERSGDIEQFLQAVRTLLHETYAESELQREAREHPEEKEP